MKTASKKESRNEVVTERPDRLIDGYLSQNLTATLDELQEQAWRTDGTKMEEAIYDRLKRLRQLRSALAALMTQDEVADVRYSVYLISAAFLREAFRALTKTRDEDLVYATGPDDGTRLFALTRMVTFNLAQRSVAHAVPEHTSQLAALQQLDRNEERLLATLHSHPGGGAGAAKPSSEDLSTQRGLERSGYPSIGAVFSRDGYVRFYAVDRLFRVAVSGAGVRQVDDCLFHITDVQPRSSHTIKGFDPRSLVRGIDSPRQVTSYPEVTMSDYVTLLDEQGTPRSSEAERVTVGSPLVLRCQTLQSDDPDMDPLPEDRQERVPGFSQAALSELTVLLVGAGALGGEIAAGLVRKGVGELKILDFDVVALSNLNRQFFFAQDVNTSKAWALARNLAPHGAMGTRIIAHNLSFEDAREGDVDLSCDVIVSAVDDGQTRTAIARFGLQRKLPVLFGGASQSADYANLFVQEVDEACFGCAFPDEVDGERTPCPGSPAIKDLFMQLGGLMVYAIDTLFMERRREWTLHSLCPADAQFTRSGRIERRPDCPICGDP